MLENYNKEVFFALLKDKEYADDLACGEGLVKEENAEGEGKEHTAQHHEDGIDRKIGGGEGFQTGGDGEQADDGVHQREDEWEQGKLQMKTAGNQQNGDFDQAGVDDGNQRGAKIVTLKCAEPPLKYEL